MIKANELRIGNRVKCTISNDAGIYTVLGIPAWGEFGNGDGVEPQILIDRCPKQMVPESKLRPIKLTPEILEGCGFVKSNEFPSWYKIEKGFHMTIQLDSTFWWCIDDVGDNEGSHLRPVNNLHNLQNIYHAVTGTELIFKSLSHAPQL